MSERVGFGSTLDVLGRVFYPVAIACVVVVLLAVYRWVGPAFAVFGLYALFGLVGGAVLYHVIDEDTRPTRWNFDARAVRLGVYATCASTIGVVALTGVPMAVLIGLAIGYVLVVSHLFTNQVSERLLAPLVALYFLSPVTKYLTSGLYIGHGDLIAHTGIVETLLASGSLQSIGYSSYQDFPGLHLVATSVSSLAGLGPHDGIVLTGMAVYAMLIPAVYLIAHRLTGNQQLSMFTAFGLVVLDDLSFFVSYAFPQSIAMVLVVILGAVATLASRDGMKWRVAAVFAVIAVVLSLTHHLTQVVVAPVVILGIMLYVAHGREYLRNVVYSRQLPLLGFAAAVTGVRLVQTGFVDRLSAKAVAILRSGLQGGYSGTVFGFGLPPRQTSVASGINWLQSAYALYLVVLLLLFSVGVVVFLRARERIVTQTVLIGCGLAGALVVFETPISIQSLIRIRFPWLFVFAFVVGIGLLWMHRYAGGGHQRALAVAVVVVAAVSAPMVTADDYYGLDPRPNEQSSFSEQETAELRAVSEHLDTTGQSVSTFYLTRDVMEHNDVTGIERPRVIDGQVILPSGHFVYRSEWPGHKIHLTTGEDDQIYSNTVYISADWLDHRVQTANKVYSVGGTGVLWDPAERPF